MFLEAATVGVSQEILRARAITLKIKWSVGRNVKRCGKSGN